MTAKIIQLHTMTDAELYEERLKAEHEVERVKARLAAMERGGLDPDFPMPSLEDFLKLTALVGLTVGLPILAYVVARLVG